MTGFGKATVELPSKKVTIEIKALNSKQLDLSTRIPSIYRENEMEVRNLLLQKLERGKVDFSIFIEYIGRHRELLSSNKSDCRAPTPSGTYGLVSVSVAPSGRYSYRPTRSR